MDPFQGDCGSGIWTDTVDGGWRHNSNALAGAKRRLVISNSDIRVVIMLSYKLLMFAVFAITHVLKGQFLQF